jgi:hypothetical protein
MYLRVVLVLVTTTLTSGQLLVGNGTGALLQSANLSWNNTSNTLSATNISGSHSGSGASLTSINASSISSGSLPLARITPLTASRILASDVSGLITTSIDSSFLDATSSIQTQLNRKQATLIAGTNITYNQCIRWGNGYTMDYS